MGLKGVLWGVYPQSKWRKDGEERRAWGAGERVSQHYLFQEHSFLPTLAHISSSIQVTELGLLEHRL